jgi:hypothetical protein
LTQLPEAGQSLSFPQEMLVQPSSNDQTGPVVVGVPQRW